MFMGFWMLHTLDMDATLLSYYNTRMTLIHILGLKGGLLATPPHTEAWSKIEIMITKSGK